MRWQARIRPLLPLFNKVLSLLAHREPDSGRETEFDDDDDTEEDYGRPVSLRGSRLNCPHPVCGRRFNRRQELRRHYGMRETAATLSLMRAITDCEKIANAMKHAPPALTRTLKQAGS